MKREGRRRRQDLAMRKSFTLSAQDTFCSYLWLSAVICGYLRLSVVICGYLRLSAVICGYLLLSAVICCA